MASPAGPESPSSEGLPLSLSLVDGRGVLQLAGARPVGPARLEVLELDIPGLRFPFDLSGGVARFRHRRCKLNNARLLLPEKELQQWLTQKVGTAGFGYRGLQLRASAGLAEIAGQATLGEQHVDFVLHGFLQPEASRAVRLALTDLHVYGPFPVPAPLLAAGLLRALCADAERRDGARLVGCTDLVLDPLQLALLRTMAAGGWRLPALTGVRLVEARLEPGKLVLDYSSERSPAAAPPRAELLRCLALQETKARSLEAEEAILTGGPRVAIDLYRRQLEEQPGQPFVVERLLQLLSADPEADDEVLRLCATSLAHDPDFPPALLAEAAVRCRRDEPAPAAEAYRRLADGMKREADTAEELLAALAAGRCAMSCDRRKAREDFERVLALDGENELALASLAPLYAEAGEWDRLVEVRKQQITRAATPEARLHGHVALGELYRVHLSDPHRAREHYELALGLDPQWEPAVRGLAEACIEGEDPLQAVRALDRLGELLAEQRDADAQVAIHLRIASIWEHLQDLQSALTRLQRAMALRPSDPEVLRRTAAVVLAQGRRREAAELLGRLLALLPDPGARQEVHRHLADLLLELDNLDEARRQLGQALALDAADPGALRVAVKLAERCGEVKALTESLGRLAIVEPNPATRAELWVRRGRLLLESGAPAAVIVASFERAAEGAADGGRAARRELAALHAREHEWEDARRCWQEVLAAGAEDAACWNGLGLACLRLGDLGAADEALQKALGLAQGGEQERGALLTLVELRREQHDAAALGQIVPRLLPLLDPIVDGELRVHLLAELAASRRTLGDLEGAADALAQGSNLAPSDLELTDQLADLEEARERWDSARALLEKLMGGLGDGPELAPRRALVGARIARICEEQEHPREAADHYRRALSLGLPPREADRVWARVIDLHLDRTDASGAARTAEAWAATLTEPERRADKLHFAAQLWLKRASQEEEALRCLRAALEQQPHHAASLDSLEAICNERRDAPALIEVLQQKVEAAVRRPALQKTLLARLGEVFAELDRRADARTAFMSALSLDGDFLPALTFLARDAFAAQELERAEIYFRRMSLRLAQPDAGEDGARLRVEVYLRLAELARRRRQHREEEGHLEMALAVDPRHPEALEQLDRLLTEQRRGPELVEVLRRRAEAAGDTDSVVALELRRAEVLDALPGRREEAATLLRHVLALSPGKREALERLERILRESGATAELTSILERRAELAETLAGDTQQARDLFREAAQLSAVALQQPERAADLFRRALRCAPAEPSLLLALLDLLGERGDAEEVEDLLQRLAAVTADPTARATLELRLARRLEGRGDPRALEVLSRAIDEGRGNLEVVSAAAVLREACGDWSEAIELYERSAELSRERGDREGEARALRRLLPLVGEHLPGAARLEPAGRRLLELVPGAREAALALAALYQEREEWASLVVILEGQLARDRDAGIAPDEEFRLTARLALALERCDRADQAGELLESCFRLTVQEPSLLWPLAGLARDLQLSALELRCLESIAVKEQPDGGLHLRMAELQRVSGKPAEAARSLAAAVQLVAVDQRARVARELLGLLDEAPDPELERLALDALLEAKVISPDEQLRLARCLARSAQPAQALALLDEVSLSPPARALRRQLLIDSGRVSELCEDEEAEARRETDPLRRSERLLEVADRWRELGEAERVTTCALGAAESAPDDEAIVQRAAKLLAAVGRAAALAPLLERLAAHEPRPEVAAQRFCRAARLLAGGPADELERLLTLAVDRDPGCVAALEGLLEHHQARGSHEQLAALLRRRAELRTSADDRALELLRGAELLQRLRRPEDGLELLRQARALRPESAEVLRAAADLHQVAGELEEAEAALVALADTGQDAATALDRAAGLAHLRGDAAAEVRYLNHLARLRPGDSLVGLRLAAACRAAGDLKQLCAVLEARGDQEPELLLEAARLHLDPLGDRAAAYDALRRFLDRQPDHREALQSMVSVCDALSKPAEAATYLRRQRDTLPAGERRLAIASELARREEAAGRLQQATEAWREALAEAPADPLVIERLGDCLARAEDWEGLCVLLEEKLASAELDTELRSRLATRLGELYLERLHDVRAGISWMATGCALAPEKTDEAFGRLLGLLRQRQEHAEAAELITRRLDQIPAGRRAPLWRELAGVLEVHLRDLKAAADAYAAAFREDPARIAEAVHAEDLFIRAGELDAALAFVDEVLTRAAEPDRAGLLAIRARVLMLKGEVDRATEEYERVLGLDPRLYAAHAELGKLRFGQGLFGAALPHLKAAGEHLADARDAATCTFLAGRALEKLGLGEEAIGWYQQAAARDPSSRPAHEALATLYEGQGAWERLATTLNVLCSISEGPARAGLLTRLAAVQRRLGQPAAALEACQRALELEPNHPEALALARAAAIDRGDWVLGADLLVRELEACRDPHRRSQLLREQGRLLSERLGRDEEAAAALLAALELDQHDREAGHLLLAIHERQGRLAEAAELARRLAAGSSVRTEQKQLLLRAASLMQALGQVDAAAQIIREIRPSDELSRAAVAVALQQPAAAAVGTVPVVPPPAVAPEPREPTPTEPLESDDWWSVAQSYRLRASKPELSPEERADLLLAAGRTLEEKLSRTLEALSVYEEAIAAAPAYLPALEALADAAYRNQDWHRARDLYDRVWQDGPQRQRVELCYRRALIYEALGDEAVADECYRRAVSLNPVHRAALEGRARLALFRDDVPVAVETLTTLERLIGVDELELLSDLRQRIGKLCLRQGNLAQAKEYLQAALALDPDRIKTIQLLLQVSEGLGDYEAMLDLLQRLICLTTDPLVRASLLHHRAEILGARLGNEEAAVDNLLKAYDLSPQYPPTLWRLVDYYWEQGDLESVAEMGEQLLQAGAIEEQPDLRQVRLAAAAVRKGHDLEIGARLLGAALAGEELAEPALVELAHASTIGAPLSALIELIRVVDSRGNIRGVAARALERQPDAPGLADLIKGLGES